MSTGFARARSEGLVVQELDGEIVVFDKATDRAHCLNEIAAIVWNACDGATAPEAIAAKLRALGYVDVDSLVDAALADLGSKGLLAGDGISRRVAIRKMSAVALSAPLVISVLAPSPAHATSGGTQAAGTVCTANQQCSGNLICTAGTPGNQGTPNGTKRCATSSTCIASGTRTGSVCVGTLGTSNATQCCSRACTGGVAGIGSRCA